MTPELQFALLKIIYSCALSGILIPLAVYFARYWWDRHRWHAFEGLIRIWAEEETFDEDISKENWNALVAAKLSEAGFEPLKIKELLELSVLFARARVSQTVRGKINIDGEDGDNE